ncbi:MAG: hypothetical protein KIS66_00500 [Fimbriimonadaceae bacterium]|nr:hypothetical protein [Fimbriimonadaceae bacterium]
MIRSKFHIVAHYGDYRIRRYERSAEEVKVRMYECSACGEKFLDAHGLIIYIDGKATSVDEGKPAVCELCGGDLRPERETPD